MTEHQLKSLSIRAGVVQQVDTGYLLACDPKVAESTGHIKIFKWHKGAFTESWANFNAMTICLVSEPDLALVFMSANGNYAIHGKSSVVGNVFEDSHPDPKEPRYGDMRSLSEIGGKAYAVGFDGTVFRLDEVKKWTRLDEGLPLKFDITAIHGFDESEVYAVGFAGEVWQFDSRRWIKREIPTNLNFTSICCAKDGNVYIGGHAGVLVRGRRDVWEVVDHESMMDKIWDVKWFMEHVYVSSLAHVYRLNKETLEMIDFGDDSPTTAYKLSTAKDVLWSIGSGDVMSFDGKAWSRII